MVVVVVYEFVDVVYSTFVVNAPVAVGYEHECLIAWVHAKNFAIGKPRVHIVRRRCIVALRALFSQRLIVGEVLVGKAAVFAVDIVFGAQVKPAEEVVNFHGETGDFVGRRQAVAKAHHALVGAVFDVFLRAGDGQKYGLTRVVDLHIGSDFNGIVIG